MDSPAARACELWFPSVMLEAVSYGPWSFATKEAVLECPEGNGRFPLPEDCLKLLKVEAGRWRMAGREVVCEEAPSLLQVRFCPMMWLWRRCCRIMSLCLWRP